MANPCPKCGDGSMGFQWSEQSVTITYTALFGEGDEVLHHDMSYSRPRPKTVVCNRCGRRMPRELAENAPATTVTEED